MGGILASTAQTGNETDAFSVAHRRLLADSSIQFDFPPPEPPRPPRETWNWLSMLADFLSTLGPVFKIVFWGALAIGLVALVFFLVRRLAAMRWRSKIAPVAASEDWRPQAAPARRLLEEADALAAAGRFAEAAHILLVRSVEDIEARMPRFVRPALTSRDIAAAQALPLPARRAFAAIARVVEAGLFGRKPVGPEGWQVARSAYALFAFGETWAREAA